MQLSLQSGRYILAISGGVDSVVLLDMLVNSNQALVDEGNLIVAHFDHGIRKNSSRDAKFVEELAEKYGLQFVVGHGGLGSNASEDTARKARYNFLNEIKKQNHADSIVTAHHRDDVIETALINLLRGTGRRGLSSLKDRKGLLRPLLGYRKSELINYAKENNIAWQEDETNESSKYLRNRIRKLIGDPRHAGDTEKLMVIIDRITSLNRDVDTEVDRLLQNKQRRSRNVIPRTWFLKLSHDLACEVVYAEIRHIGVQEVDSKLIEMLVVFMKTAKIGKKMTIDKEHTAFITKRSIRFVKH